VASGDITRYNRYKKCLYGKVRKQKCNPLKSIFDSIEERKQEKFSEKKVIIGNPPRTDVT
jgi:hypothetical protein